MTPEEINKKISHLQSTLDTEMKKYDTALDENAGFDVRKKIRSEMRLIGEKIVKLREILKQQGPSIKVVSIIIAQFSLYQFI